MILLSIKSIYNTSLKFLAYHNIISYETNRTQRRLGYIIVYSISNRHVRIPFE